MATKYTIKRAKEEHDLSILAEKNVLDRKELMAWFSLSYDWITEHIKKGMPYSKIGSVIRFSKEDVERYLIKGQ